MAQEMKDSGIPWIGEIPFDWNVVSLKRLCSMQAGKNLISEQIKPSGQYPVYGGNGVRGYFDEFNIDGEYLLVGRQGALCGNVHRVIGKFWATEHAVVTAPSKLAEIDFLFYLLIAMNLNQYASNVAAQPGLSVNSILNVKTYVVPLVQQKHIAEFLDKECAKIDTVLAKTRTSIEEYKKLKQAIITQAVTKGIRGDRPMKESGIEWAPLIPEDWSNYRGKHLFYETNERSETGSEELLTVSHKTGITPRSQKNVNMFMSESLVGYKICREGDIAANTMWMWQGAIGVSAYYGVISPSYNTYRQRNGAFDPQYLDYLLRIPPLVDQYNVCSTGIIASRLRLYPEQFLSLRFIVPPMEEQQEIVMFLRSRVDEMDALIQKKEQFLAELETYKKSLIYEYVTGKKEVV